MSKKGLGWVFLIIVLVIVFFIFYYFSGFKITGSTVSNAGMPDGEEGGPPAGSQETHTIGPSAEEQACLMTCSGCTIGDAQCIAANTERCSAQCNAVKPEETEDTKCMETCVAKGCKEFDFSCQRLNQATCEKECNMIKAPDESTMSKEQKCISDCVNAEKPGTICGASQTGETGNALCQRCAKSCEHLYEGPCLGEEKLESKKKECETCEHCYGEPKMGDSGEGWECIVDVECNDASSEFGDEPGIGEGISSVVSGVGDAIGDVASAIGDFFSGLFGGGEETGGEGESSGEEAGTI